MAGYRKTRVCQAPGNITTQMHKPPPHFRSMQVPAVGPTGPPGVAGQTRVAYWEEYDHEAQAHEVQEQQNQAPQLHWFHILLSRPEEEEPFLHLKEMQG